MLSGKWLVLAGGIVSLGLALAGMWWLGDAVTHGPAAGHGRGDGGAAPRGAAGKAGQGDGPDGGERRRGAVGDGREDPHELHEAVALLRQLSEDDLAGEVSRMAAGWDRERLGEAVAALTASAAGAGPEADLRDALLRRWWLTNRDEAAAWVAGVVSQGGGATEASLVALIWRETDADAAWSWVESLAAGDARDAAQRSLLYEWAREDAALALERLPAGVEGREWDLLVEHAVANLAAEDPQAALAWVKQLTDPSRRDRAFGSLATAWAESDPAAAATLAAAAMVEGPQQDRAVAAVVQRWAQQDPAAARAWVETFPDSPLKQDATRLIEEQAPREQETGGTTSPPPRP